MCRGSSSLQCSVKPARPEENVKNFCIRTPLMSSPAYPAPLRRPLPTSPPCPSLAPWPTPEPTPASKRKMQKHQKSSTCQHKTDFRYPPGSDTPPPPIDVYTFLKMRPAKQKESGKIIKCINKDIVKQFQNAQLNHKRRQEKEQAQSPHPHPKTTKLKVPNFKMHFINHTYHAPPFWERWVTPKARTGPVERRPPCTGLPENAAIIGDRTRTEVAAAVSGTGLCTRHGEKMEWQADGIPSERAPTLHMEGYFQPDLPRSDGSAAAAGAAETNCQNPPIERKKEDVYKTSRERNHNRGLRSEEAIERRRTQRTFKRRLARRVHRKVGKEKSMGTDTMKTKRKRKRFGPRPRNPEAPPKSNKMRRFI